MNALSCYQHNFFLNDRLYLIMKFKNNMLMLSNFSYPDIIMFRRDCNNLIIASNTNNLFNAYFKIKLSRHETDLLILILGDMGTNLAILKISNTLRDSNEFNNKTY